ncbi:MAG: class I SAM-dependent methyltransferase [Rickettsiales bacterium]
MAETPSRYLLFPGGMPESLSLMSTLTRARNGVVGASSIVNDASISLYEHWTFLPLVNAPEFKAELLRVIAEHGITAVYCPHTAIGQHLKSMAARGDLQVELVVEEFARRSTEHQNSVLARVKQYEELPLVLDARAQAPALSTLQKTSLIIHALRAEGQSNDDKLLAMIEVARSCPQGDMVEIGTFWGRSAMMLAMLNQHYPTGNLLCIDPWTNDGAIQPGVDEHVNDVARMLDFESAFTGFILNLFAFSGGGAVNYVRANAVDVAPRYVPGFTVTTQSFGTTTYTGEIALLHIDGNHALDAVTRDIALWMPRVKPGGWIIIDDYQWAFGDGPHVAADLWMENNHTRVQCAFATGSALFIQLK